MGNDHVKTATKAKDTRGVSQPHPPAQMPEQTSNSDTANETPMKRLLRLLRESPSDEALSKAIFEVVSATVDKHTVATRYNVIILYDESALLRDNVNRLYKSLQQCNADLPVLLILYSYGGSIEAGYFVSKLCREHGAGKFCVAVPRLAKSAATLICCGADEIHMGGISELGPIDPQRVMTS